MKKVILYSAISLLLMALVWYLFIKDYDYKITFRTPQAPGIVYSTLEGWNNWEPNSLKAVSTISEEPFSELTQELKVSDSIIDIKWTIERESDSVTKVTAFLTDKEHSLAQKLKVPFIKTDFVRRGLATAEHIKVGLKLHQEDYKVSKVEKTLLKATTCAYVTLECKLNEKAQLMMGHTNDVMEYLRNNNIELKGDPFIEVTRWNLKDDQITFDFCFPIDEQDSYPDSKHVKIKQTKEQQVLKTMFNGNYKLSDRGWFTLMDYAERNNIEVKNLPIEVFLNDPHSGGDELKWQAEIYLPIKNKTP